MEKVCHPPGDCKWQCDNLQCKVEQAGCNNMSRMNVSGYVGHATIFN